MAGIELSEAEKRVALLAANLTGQVDALRPQVERLVAENERLRAALEKIAEIEPLYVSNGYEMRIIAKRALND